MDNEGVISDQLSTLIALLTKNNASVKPEKTPEKPRQVVTTNTKVDIENISDNTKKFLASLFKFEQPEVKKMADKKTNFWMDILTLLGAGIYAVYQYFKNKIQPMLTLFADLFKSEGLIGKFLESVSSLFRRFKTIFREDGNIFKFFKELELIFSKEGKLFKIFELLKTKLSYFIEAFSIAKGGKIEELLAAINKAKISFIEKMFLRVGAYIGETANILSKVLKPFEPLLNKAKFLGRILERMIWPVQVLFGVWEGWSAYSKEMTSGSKDKAIASLKSILAAVLNFVTLGFLNLSDIEISIESIVKDFNKGNILSQITKTFLLIPEGILKLAAYFGNWVSSLFYSPEENAAMKEIIRKWSLSDVLTQWGESVGEWFVDMITTGGEYITDVIQGMQDFFTTTVPDKIYKVSEQICNAVTGFFDKIINFDYTSILEKVPGYSKIKKFLSGKEVLEKDTIKPTKAVAANTAQDYISRPGQPIQQFTSKDTVIGFKEGGPILNQLTSNATFSKDFNKLSLKYYGDNINALIQIREAVNHLVNHLKAAEKSNVIVSNKTNNIAIPSMGTAGTFRQSYLQ